MDDIIKRAARKRMAETGENYTTARRKVIEEHARCGAVPAEVPSPDIASPMRPSP